MFNKLKRFDLPIVIILVMFMITSTLVVHSATVDDPNISVSITKSLVFYGIGFVAFFLASMTDYRILLKIAVYLYITGIVSLLALIPFGTVINGAKGWFKIPGGMTFQPAELMKLLLIIAIAAWLAKRKGDILELRTDVLPVALIVLVPFTIVLVQPDLGNAIIFVIILLGMLWIGNIKYTHVLIGVSIVIGFMALFLFLYQQFYDPISTFLKEHDAGHWVKRIDTFLKPEDASRDAKFQVMNSIQAIGSGGLKGEGFLNGSSVHSRFIPLAYSDSIFVVVGEEFGFRGAALLLLLYFVLIYRMILISIQSVEIGGAYLIVGVVSMFVFQIFENVGMLMGIMPLTGITLPFISYGGTSLLINMLCMGMVMSVRLHQDKQDMFPQ